MLNLRPSSQPLGHDSLMCIKREDMQNSQDLYRQNSNLIYLDLHSVVVENFLLSFSITFLHPS